MPGRSRQCVILAGGFGTRLGALTADTPKPLLEVAGKPFVAHLIDNARRFGFDDFIVLAGFRADKVEAFARAIEAELPIRVRVVAEPEPAGTAGALTFARDLLADEFLMLNGDSMFDFNWLDLATAPAPAGWQARLGLRNVDDASRFGSVELAGQQIRAFREKAQGSGPGLINGGVYWLRRDLLDEIRAMPCSLEQDVFPVLATRGTAIGAAYGGPFIDIGVPGDLAAARLSWQDMRRRPAAFFDRDGVLNHDDGYTHRIEEFRWREGAREAIRLCNDAGRLVFVVTNQAGVARGLYPVEAVETLHGWMNADLRETGAHIDAFRFCPHHPDGVVAAYARDCECRKPCPGMITSLLASWPVDAAASFLIGDKPSDIAAAQAGGIAGHLLTDDGDLFEECRQLLLRSTTPPR